MHLGGEHRLAQFFERGDVLHDPDAAPVRADDEVVLAFLDLDVVHRHRRHVPEQRVPRVPGVDREVGPDLVAGEEEVGRARVLLERVHRPSVRQPVRHRPPRLAVVVRHVEVWRHVVVAVVVARHPHRARVGMRGDDPRHVQLVGHARHVERRVRPCAAAVPGDLQVPVVRARVDHHRVER